MEANNFNQQPVYVVPGDVVPTGKYAPISAWGYFGYSLLFSIPIIGFIFLIIFSFSSANINRRSFARSFFCYIVVLIILVAVLGLLGVNFAVLLNNLNISM